MPQKALPSACLVTSSGIELVALWYVMSVTSMLSFRHHTTKFSCLIQIPHTNYWNFLPFPGFHPWKPGISMDFYIDYRGTFGSLTCIAVPQDDGWSVIYMDIIGILNSFIYSIGQQFPQPPALKLTTDWRHCLLLPKDLMSLCPLCMNIDRQFGYGMCQNPTDDTNGWFPFPAQPTG